MGEIFTGSQDYKIHSTDAYSYFDNNYTNSAGYSNVGGKANLLKTLATGKKVSLSIGGYTSGVWIQQAISGSNQTGFADSIVQFMKKQEQAAQASNIASIHSVHRFYGVDVDWEPNNNSWSLPSQANGSVQLTKIDLINYLNFLIYLKSSLTANGYSGLTIAVSANPDVLQNVDATYGGGYWKKIAKVGVVINLMTYDYHAQGWAASTCPKTQFSSPLQADLANPCQSSSGGAYSVANSVQTMIALGVPTTSLGSGAPGYGYAWALTPQGLNSVTASNPYEAFDNTPQSITNVAFPGGGAAWTYRSIISGYAYGVPTANNSFSINTGATWTTLGTSTSANQSWATATINGTPAWISYSSPNNMRAYGAWARKTGLGSVIFWSMDQDAQRSDNNVNNWDQQSLVYNLKAGLIQ